jgi:acetyl-CoA carboxylase carboxyltransferase component
VRGRPAVPANWDASARRGLVNDGRLGAAARRGLSPPVPGDGSRSTEVIVRAGPLSPGGRPVVSARAQPSDRGRALTADSAAALASAAELARQRRLPLVLWLASSGSDLAEGVAALDGWGRVAGAMARCSGTVPVVVVVDGALLSGPALLLGLADAVVMTSRAVAYVSGPAAVAELTGVAVRPAQLGGAGVHATRSGVATVVVPDADQARATVDQLLSFLPAHCDELPPVYPSADPVTRATPELRDVIPERATGSYDVRKVIAPVADDGRVFELRPSWAPQLVTALVRVGGHPVGVVANQPQALSGTLDIAASQKGAHFVAFCDAFNVGILTLVDTSGFMPGRDLEWRGIIRHGAELVFAYAEATVPRVCLVLRKAYGGAYIVMDSKGMGNDFCIAWPSAELAVLGAEAAVSIVHRRADDDAKARLVEEYRRDLLNPYVAAERGYVDMVIDPAGTRLTVARCFATLRSKREQLVARKHGNSPL